MYLVKTPWWLKKMYPSLTWQIPTEQKDIFLTFDDGPHPEITPFVLDTLKENNAKATFFCLGKNVENNRSVYKQIIKEGHSIGNHTYTHVNGWKVSDDIYLKEVIKAKKIIDSNLFRPPYGRIGRFQIQQIKKLFNIVMWNVLSGDFDVAITPEQCLRNVIENVQPGSVIVFHDSEKAFPRLKVVLPQAMQFFKEKGYTCKRIIL